jgi:hypothetical protein
MSVHHYLIGILRCCCDCDFRDYFIMESDKSVWKSEWRSYVKIRTKLGSQATDIHADLVKVYGADNSPSYRVVAEWRKRFAEGRESVDDDTRCGRTITAQTDENVASVRELVEMVTSSRI